LIAHANGFVELAQGMDVHLGGVQHCFEVGVIESDRLAVALDGVFELPLQGRHVTEQIVCFRGLVVEFEGSPRRQLRTARVATLDEVPAAVQVCRELIHRY
jgi:hypothetical protein